MHRDSDPRPTRLLVPDDTGIAEAAAILRAGGLVAFPTETVYGLGAHALDARAVRGIFEAKGRPADDPLIVHLGVTDQVEGVAVANAVAWRLAERFWPGPLTLVLRKRSCVPLELTAGLPTVAVRVPAHAVAQALLLASGMPLAAPSANSFGRPSPTRAAHVLEDLDGRIDAVIDAGATPVGVESTIVDVSRSPARLLRPGGLAAEAIEDVLGERLTRLAPPNSSQPGPQAAPGLMPVHYSPRTALTLIVGEAASSAACLRNEVDAAVAAGKRVGVVALEEDRVMFAGSVRCQVVGSWADPVGSATRLFEVIRTLDAADLDVLFVRELADPSVGLGLALADRLRRAAHRIIQA
ncbi:MAG: L-threonylcarbamoyladenylate synthase [Chloroflexota bacterium]